MNLIPGAGIVASALYKSNNRNLTLLRKWQEGHAHDVRRGSFIFFIVLILLFLAIVTLWISLWIAIIWVIRNTLFAWL
jgi:Flp pilus assembly protein TadB